MIALFLIPVYIAVNIYICLKINQWTKACHGICHTLPFKIALVSVYSLLAASPGIAFLFEKGSNIQRIFQVQSNFWMGVFLYTLMALVVCVFIGFLLVKLKLITKETRKGNLYVSRMGGIVLIFVIVISVNGLFTSKSIRVTDYDVNIDKAMGGEEMRIVLIADMHMGYNMGAGQVEKMVDKINEQKPDLVCFAGDIFNNDFDAINYPKKVRKALASIESTYGSYACYGNHDVKETIVVGFTFNLGNKGADRPYSDPRMDKLLKDSNITLLQDEVEIIDDKFYIGGRLDAENPGRVAGIRKTESEMVEGLDKSKPIIMIDHIPADEALDGLAAAGVDLDLSGHTHDGQFFPMNLTSRMMWRNSAGMIQVGDMVSIVTSGVGTYGPDLRVGTKSEVCCIDVQFK